MQGNGQCMQQRRKVDGKYAGNWAEMFSALQANRNSLTTLHTWHETHFFNCGSRENKPAAQAAGTDPYR